MIDRRLFILTSLGATAAAAAVSKAAIPPPLSNPVFHWLNQNFPSNGQTFMQTITNPYTTSVNIEMAGISVSTQMDQPGYSNASGTGTVVVKIMPPVGTTDVFQDALNPANCTFGSIDVTVNRAWVLYFNQALEAPFQFQFVAPACYLLAPGKQLMMCVTPTGFAGGCVNVASWMSSSIAS